MKKPIIGLTANYSTKDEIGTISKLGAPGQSWQLLADNYVRAIELAGGIPVIIPISGDPEVVGGLLDRIDGIVFTGGNDVNPQLYGQVPSASLGEVSIKRDAVEAALMKKALSDYHMPVFGICRGCQLLNIVQGGTLHQDLLTAEVTERQHFLLSYPIEAVSQSGTVSEDSRLFSVLKRKEIGINSYHHQAVDRLGEDLVAAAEAGDGIIEAIEMKGDRFVIGVQWHPEMMTDGEYSYRDLFSAFVEACGAVRS